MARQRQILILGAGVMQGPAIRCAKAMGLRAAVVDGDPGAPLAGEADHFEAIDLKDIDKIEQFARLLRDNGGLDGVITAGTDFSAAVAYVAEKLGLPGISYETALNASDKERMRNCFKEKNLPSPAFTVTHAGYTGSDYNLPFSCPVVVKPVDNMGARGCRRADNKDELRAAVQDAMKYSRSGRVIIEEYMEGPEFSIDAVVFRGEITVCGFADRHIFFPPYFIEMGHTMPSDISPKDEEAIIEVFKQGIKALGIDNGAAKGDIKLTKNGPMIGEIAARLSGGYMSGWTYPYASGADPAKGAICIALGQKPEGIDIIRNWTSAERAFISIPGIIQSIEGLENARNIGGVKDLFLRTEAGKRISFPENNVSKAGNIISAAPTRGEAIKAAEEAAKTIHIRLKAPDETTDAFLAGPIEISGNKTTDSRLFPPPAYILNNELLEQLSKMAPGTKFYQEMNHGGHGVSQRKSTITRNEVSGIRNNKEFSNIPHSSVSSVVNIIRIIPFPDFTGSNLTDYAGRTPGETLEAVQKLTGLEFTEQPADFQEAVLGREFWRALIRGGYQGAVYYIDTLFLDAGLGIPGAK